MDWLVNMPNTFTLIETKSLASNSNTILFSSIPDTYTDLILFSSVRNAQNNYGGYYIYFNNTN